MPAALAHLKIAAIGPATRKAIEAHGVTRAGHAEGIRCRVGRHARLRRRVKGKRVLLVRAKVARDVIPRELRKAGARVDVIEAYETVVPEASADAAARASGQTRHASRTRLPSPVPRP